MLYEILCYRCTLDGGVLHNSIDGVSDILDGVLETIALKWSYQWQ